MANNDRVTNRQNVHSECYSYLNLCKFRVNDSIRLLETVKTKSVVFPEGSNMTITDIKIRKRNLPMSTFRTGEAYSYELMDSSGNILDHVGQYMFDPTLIVSHKEKLNALKRLCFRGKAKIFALSALKITLLVMAIVLLLAGAIKYVLSEPPSEFDESYVIIAVSLFVVFLSVSALESIKFPGGLDKVLRDKVKMQADLIHCYYDNVSMNVWDK